MILATASFLLSATQPSLAFVARFYKAGNAKSQFELYVSDMQGNNRKVLKTPVEPVAVQWIGHDRLAWFSENALYTSKLSPWKPVLVKKTSTLHFGESRWRHTEPGMPELVEDFDRSKGVFVLDLKSLKLEPAMPTPGHGEYPLPDSKPTKYIDPNDPNHPIIVNSTKSDEFYEGFEYYVGGKVVKQEWPVYRAWYDDGQNKVWIWYGSHTSTSGNINALMLFQKGKTPKALFDNANAVDFWPARDLYAYCTPRDTSTLGKKEVWTSELHLGDWKKGYDRPILKGLVWAPSVSIRP